MENRTAIVSVTSNAASLENVKHISFENLTVEAFRADAIRLQNCSHNRIVGCTIRNVGSWAVQVKGGTDNRVIGCEITQTGSGGINLNGGDRPKLESAGHLADNNHIHHYSRWKRMYQPAISINGVGNRVTHNLIHHAPHMAIGFSGNEHLIEFNEIHHVCQESNDAGAIYTGRDWTMRGTIIRHNFLHHINGFEGRGCVGVYLDDMFCGTLIFGNLFYKVTRAAFIGGGRDGTVENNIFVDCEPALHIDARATGWANYHVDTTMKDRLFAMPFQESRWADHYPQLLTLWQDDPAAPKGNVVARNISQGGRWDGVRDEARPFIHFEDNLIDQLTETVGGDAPTDFRISDQLLLQKINFRSIPTEQIGLRRD